MPGTSSGEDHQTVRTEQEIDSFAEGDQMMKSWLVAALCGTALLVSGAGAGEKENACLEGPMEQFGRYVGDWKIEDEAFARDGSGWSPGKGARWIFKCVGDGTAVQDFWKPNGGGWGTNLRTYNADTGSWEIVWAATGLNGLMHISATQDESGRIVMDVLKPEQSPPRRIIFMPPHDDGWNWVQEWSFDGGTSWTPVYRISATPWSEDAG